MQGWPRSVPSSYREILRTHLPASFKQTPEAAPRLSLSESVAKSRCACRAASGLAGCAPLARLAAPNRLVGSAQGTSRGTSSAEEEAEPRAAMEGLRRLLRAGEDAAPGASAASHDGRECAGVGGEATQRAALALGPGLPGPEAACQGPAGLPGRRGPPRPPFLPPPKDKMGAGAGGGGGGRLNTSCFSRGERHQRGGVDVGWGAGVWHVPLPRDRQVLRSARRPASASPLKLPGGVRRRSSGPWGWAPCRQLHRPPTPPLRGHAAPRGPCPACLRPAARRSRPAVGSPAPAPQAGLWKNSPLRRGPQSAKRGWLLVGTEPEPSNAAAAASCDGSAAAGSRPACCRAGQEGRRRVGTNEKDRCRTPQRPFLPWLLWLGKRLF